MTSSVKRSLDAERCRRKKDELIQRLKALYTEFVRISEEACAYDMQVVVSTMIQTSVARVDETILKLHLREETPI